MSKAGQEWAIMKTTGMPALREETSHSSYLRTADPAAGILAAQKAGMQGGKVYVGHPWDPAADEQGALCKEHRSRKEAALSSH